MPGASEFTRQVKVLNANWVAGPDSEDGRFELMIVTENGQQHTVAPSPTSMPALLAMARADAILLWDPTHQTLIAANLVGAWLEETPTGVAPAANRVGEA